MEESDHLGNSFSDEDSFDDPVPNCISGETGKGDEEEIEGVEDEMEDEEEEEDEEMQREMLEEGDFNLLTIDNREREESAENGERYLMLLVAKIAVKNKSMDSEDLLIQLIILIDRFYYHTDSFVRCRVCRLIAILVEEENRYLETMRELGDYEFLFTDDEPAEVVTMIPIKVKNRWMEKLAKSLFDKSPQCRSCALAALSLWDQNVVYKASTPNCDKITIEDLIWRSLHDVDESVRLTASRTIHIINETDIDKCMNHVEMSRDNRVRQAIVTRLASDVHLFSFSDQQKFRFINLLSSSDSVRVRDVIHQRLVESWMKVVGEEIVSPKIFPDALPENNIPKQFPSIILDYLDPEIDAKAVYIFMKFATVRFIRSPSNSNELSRDADLEKFMKDLLKLNDSDSESIGLMRRTTWRLVEKYDLWGYSRNQQKIRRMLRSI
uniref:Uncharacterized protein n=1 Tax=Caenorhabditis japonica TaxID=281687 RepID=A0A8R1I6B1_CAEJA